MTEYFQYSSNPQLTIQTPIWSDNNQESEMSKFLIKTKSENGPEYWDNMSKIINYDYSSLPLERFKVWMSVMSVPFMSNHKHSEYIRRALQESEFSSVVKNALLETFIGMNREDFDKFYRVFSDFDTTMNRMQHYGHLSINGYTPAVLSKMDKIIEIGGGVGDMTDIIYKLGFSGEYILYDLPEVSKLQKWHHDQLGLDKVKHTSSIEDLTDADLVIATWSLTEMPFYLRTDVVEKIKKSSNFLIAYSKLIFGMDNEKWINESFIPNLDKNKQIDFIDIPWMSWDGGTKYLNVFNLDQSN